ncbi:MAG: radical SAM protein [Clostridia bacterium]|nr:radical SAM protein [Clostridia bacterium]
MKDKANVSYQTKRVKLGDILPLDTPFSITLDVSEVCNLRCSYCFRCSEENRTNSYAWKNNLMEEGTFYRAVSQIKEFPDKVKKISLSGHGEPLCNRKIIEMIKYLKVELPETVIEIHTNATLLDEAYALALAESGIDKVNISLQGLSAEKYKEVCGGNINFEKFLAAIEILYKNRKNTIVNVKIVDAALDEENNEKRFHELFDKISDHAIIEKVVPIWKIAEYRNSKETTNKFGEEIPYQRCCSLLFYSLYVAPDGTIYACSQPEVSFNLGTIFDTTLLAAWNGEKRKNFLLSHLELGRATIEDCKDCYIAQNSIMTEEDTLNDSYEDILKRMRDDIR